MSPSLTARTTFWSSGIGYSAGWLTYVGLNQNCVQRMVAVPTVNHARRAMWLFALGFIIITSITCFTGLIIYAQYHTCDPLKAGLINKPDQILPFFVQDVVGHMKGIPGLFNSCVFSAGLSSMSAIMNSVAGVIYQDYVRPTIGKGHSEAKADLWLKGLVVAIGLFCICSEFVVGLFPYMLDLVYSLSALSNGPALGVFMLGLFCPIANRKGALAGMVISIVCIGYLVTGNLMAKMRGEIVNPTLNTTTEGCFDMGINVTQVKALFNDTVEVLKEKEFSVHHISFQWLTFFGAIILWLVALPASMLFKDEKEGPPNPALLAPMIRSLCADSYHETKKEMQLTKIV